MFSVGPRGGREEAEQMESLLITKFEHRHYTIPIANGQHGVRYRGGEDSGRDSDCLSLRQVGQTVINYLWSVTNGPLVRVVPNQSISY